MKKILLATTALAAVSVASVAQAQESNMMSAGGNTLNIGGYYEFGWASRSDDNKVPTGEKDGDESRTYGDSELFIDFETTSDDGLTYGVQVDLELVNGSQHGESGSAKNAEESNIYLSGDFGTINLGHDDYASDNFLIWAPTHEGALSQDDGVYFTRFAPSITPTASTSTATLTGDFALTPVTTTTDNTETPADVSMGAAGSNAGTTSSTPDDTEVMANGNTVINAGDATVSKYTVVDGAPSNNVRYFGNAASYNDSAKITYLSPSFSGFKFGGSFADSDAKDDEEYNIGVGASYTHDLSNVMEGASFKLAYAYQTNGEDNKRGADVSTTRTFADGNTVDVVTAAPLTSTESEMSSFGGSLSLNNLTLTASYFDSQNGDVSAETTEVGIGYTISDALSLGYGYATGEAETERKSQANIMQEGTFHSASASYSIAPGLKTTLAYNVYDLTQDAYTTTYVNTDDDFRVRDSVGGVSNDGSEIVWQVEFAF